MELTVKETGKVIVSRGEDEIEVDQEQEIEISPNVMAEACDVVNNKIKKNASLKSADVYLPFSFSSLSQLFADFQSSSSK